MKTFKLISLQCNVNNDIQQFDINKHHVIPLGPVLSRVQHLRCSHLHLQSCLYDPGVSVFGGIMYR